MLTITAPIELKCKTPDHSVHEGFYHRIADPYGMLSANLSPEDLLHVMTTPPEYYFGGGDEMNIFQQTNVNTRQENKLEVINNLVNRIMVSGSAALTYQDRVYITDVLQKLGIRNVSEFMYQVDLIRQEQYDTNKLIDLYWDHAGDLRQLVENYRMEQEEEHVSQQLIEQKETLHLHEDILNRLQTAAIYQTVVNFNSQRQGEQNITNTELALSEQYRVAQNILLQKLKSEARGEETPLVFRHENYYEEKQLSEEQITEENVLSQISSAVLLNLIDNIYQSRSEQKIRGGENWYHMERAFYQNAENTMQRIEQRISSQYETNRHADQIYQLRYQQLQKNEIRMMTQLFEEQTSEQYQTVSELLHQELLRQELVNRMAEVNVNQQLLEENEQLIQSNYSLDRSSQVMNRLMDKHIAEIDQSNRQMITQLTEQVKQELSSDQYLQNRFDQIDIQFREGDLSEEQNTYEQTRNVVQQQISENKEQIKELRQEQLHAQETYLQTVEGIRETLERSSEIQVREGETSGEQRIYEQIHDETIQQTIEHTKQIEKLRQEQLRTQEEYQQTAFTLQETLEGTSNIHIHEGDQSEDQSIYEQIQNVTKQQTIEHTEQTEKLRQEQLQTQERYLQTALDIRETIEQSAARTQSELSAFSQTSGDAETEAAGVSLVNVDLSGGDVLEEQSVYDQSQQIDQQNVTNIRQEISNLQREHITDQSKYIQVMDAVWEAMKYPEQSSGSEEPHRESRMSLEHSEEQSGQTQTEGEGQLQAGQKNISRILNQYFQQNQMSGQNVTRVEQELTRISRADITDQSKYIQMMNVIRDAMEYPRQNTSSEEIRRESRMPLEHPGEFQGQQQTEGDAWPEAGQEKAAQIINQISQQNRIDRQNVTNVDQELSQFNLENTTDQRKYIEIMDGIRERIDHPKQTTHPEELHPERQMSLESPGELSGQQAEAETQFEAGREQAARIINQVSQQNRIDRQNVTNVEQELSRINRENINNQYKYIQMMDGIRASMERPQENKSPGQMRRESLMALEHPEQLMDQLRAEGQELHQAKQAKLAEALHVLPEQTRAVYETVREYLEAPMELRREMSGVSDDMGMLIRDIHEAQVVQKQSELIHKQQEQLHEQTKEVIDRWNEKTPVEPQKKQVYEDRRMDVTLVHRSQEQQVDEEFVQQMIEQNNRVNRTVHTQNETVTNYDTTARTYQNVNTQQVVEQTENVSELVRQGVQRELGALSEKIYRKLEKRLESEKRRRGF